MSDSRRGPLGAWRARIDCVIVELDRIDELGDAVLVMGFGSRPPVTGRVPRQVRQSCASQRKCSALNFFGLLIIGMGNVLFAQASGSPAPAAPPPAAAMAPAHGQENGVPPDRKSPWFIILNAPPDIDALWQRIEHPDLMLIKVDHPRDKELRDGLGGKRDEPLRWLVESVQVRGQVVEDFVKLTVELRIVVKGAESVWVPIDRKSVV